MTLACRDLRSLDDFRAVVALERDVWGMADEDLVPAPLLLVSAKCGAIVVGAFDGARPIGFVYSFPGERHGVRMQWSHMLGVLPAYRDTGVGRRLKLLQRERALGQGLSLIEWTYDPLQPSNAYFNLSKLGVIVREYVPDAYGQTQSPLHRGAPTDRFVAQWWLRDPAVERLAAEEREQCRPEARPTAADGAGGTPQEAEPEPEPAGTAIRGALEMPMANAMIHRDGWWRCQALESAWGAPVLGVAVPPDFSAMLAGAPELAGEWRRESRALFERAFAEGYAVTGYERARTHAGGRYVLKHLRS